MARSSNAAAVQAMWEAFNREGIDAFLALAPDDVEWRPSTAGGRPLWGSRDLREMFRSLDARGERIEAKISAIEEIGEDAVLVTGTLRRFSPQGTAEDQMAWLYSFRDGRLWRATSHYSAAEAREAARFSGANLSQQVQRAPVLTVVDETIDEQTIRLALRGELDLGSAPLFAQAVDEFATPGRTLLVDLGGLDFMDSTGMRAILVANRKAADAGWTLRLGRAPEHVQRVFEVTGIDKLLPFVTPRDVEP